MGCGDTSIIALTIVFSIWLCVLNNRVWGRVMTLVVAIGLLLFLLWSEPIAREYLQHPNDTTYISELKHECFKVIDTELQSIPVFSGRSSYTDNKEVIYVCIKDRKGNYYPKQCLMYVLLHEYAHAVTPKGADTSEHGDVWQSNFQKYLDRAIELGLYDPDSVFPMEYMMECSES